MPDEVRENALLAPVLVGNLSTQREEWRAIPSAPGYEASSRGRVRSTPRAVPTARGERNLPGRVLQPWPAGKGYEYVDVAGRHRSVHVLVAEAWLGSRPAGSEVCHGPAGMLDNAPSNLRYDTSTANHLDAVRDGTHAMAARQVCPREHRLVEPNLVARHANRTCLACRRATSRAARMRRDGCEVAEVQVRAWADEQYAEITGVAA